MLKENTKLNEITLGGPVRALVPQSFDDAVRMGRLALKAGLFKPTKVANDNDDSNAAQEAAEAQATMAIMQGLECNIPPMQALQNISIINGRACIWGALVPALLWSNGFELDESIEGEDTERMTAVCMVTRPSGKTITRKFSVQDAVKAGLWQTHAVVKRWKWVKGQQGVKEWYEVDNDSPWWKYPKRMLQMRARGFAANDGAADVMRGMYVREEMEDTLRTVTIEREEDTKISMVELAAEETKPIQVEVKQIEATKEEAVIYTTGTLIEAVTDLDTSMQAAKTEDEVHEIWHEHLEAIAGAGIQKRHLFDAVFEKHIERTWRAAGLPAWASKKAQTTDLEAMPAAVHSEAHFDMLAV